MENGIILRSHVQQFPRGIRGELEQYKRDVRYLAFIRDLFVY